MRRTIERFGRSGSGATLIEVGVIAALMAVLALGALRAVGSNLTVALWRVGNGLSPTSTIIVDLGRDDPGHDDPGHDDPGHDDPSHADPGSGSSTAHVAGVDAPSPDITGSLRP